MVFRMAPRHPLAAERAQCIGGSSAVNMGSGRDASAILPGPLVANVLRAENLSGWAEEPRAAPEPARSSIRPGSGVRERGTVARNRANKAGPDSGAEKRGWRASWRQSRADIDITLDAVIPCRPNG